MRREIRVKIFAATVLVSSEAALDSREEGIL